MSQSGGRAESKKHKIRFNFRRSISKYVEGNRSRFLQNKKENTRLTYMSATKKKNRSYRFML